MVLASAILWQGAAEATVVLAIPVARLVQTADWIVVGTVIELDCHYEMIGGSERTVTDARVQIDHVVANPGPGKALPSTVITVRTLGGTIDGISEVVFGEAVLREGSSTLLFLRQGSADYFGVPGMAQGEYVIQKDADGTQRLKQSRGIDVIIHPEKSAVATLAGRTLKQAEAILSEVAGKARTLP
jgi:hypothetical protein